jgi:signal transduction histidine kinase
VTVESDDHRVRISVTDDGPGIPPELGDEVFEPFFTTATTFAQSATTARGLGLTLARSVAERHGGTLVFEPTEAGASAVLELPRAVS